MNLSLIVMFSKSFLLIFSILTIIKSKQGCKSIESHICIAYV